ncbi:MAG: primosomal protein N' [Saprospiraceae bacterium]
MSDKILTGSVGEEHFIASTNTFVEVILPVATPKPTYTYYVDKAHLEQVQFGIRVEVQFGKNKLYSGIVAGIHSDMPTTHEPKAIVNVMDDEPIINLTQLKLWKWIASYYACTLGEVMNAALPANLKLSSETRLLLNPDYGDDFSQLNDREYLIAEALTMQAELKIEDVRKIIGQYTVYPLIKRLLEEGVLYLKEEMLEKYKPKTVKCVRLAIPYRNQMELLDEAFSKLSRSNKQVEALMAYIQESRKEGDVSKVKIQEIAGVDSSVTRAIEQKGIFEFYDLEISRISKYGKDLDAITTLSEQQVRALTELKEQFQEKNVVLLHGVTGSGKTRVYIEVIQAALARGEQVLYLLPEIALTTQIIMRLQKMFGDKIAVYHSKLNSNERVEVYKSAAAGAPILIGPRSTLFLPFRNLKWVIVDEEHDGSYKQHDPNPRYHGRDTAIYLAHLHGAKVLLGTATPAVETFHHTKTGKYGLVTMQERFGGSVLPKLQIIDLKEQTKKKQMQSHFSLPMIKGIKETVASGRQVILFQNRRGYSPTLQCESCAWSSECVHCDVTLTYHKHTNKLQCHYCGYQKDIPKECPACGSAKLHMKGFGTEKVEDDLKVYLPELRVSRLDLDTVRGKNALLNIIQDFEERRVDVLIGTQMVTKGLDFENVGLVGVLNSDMTLSYPDFRSSERGFQLLTQVSGRSGRGKERGTVMVQAYDTNHPVLGDIGTADYISFFTREIGERQAFKYPPYYRLIKVTLKHKKPSVLNTAAKMYAHFLRKHLGDRVIGPAIPGVSRIRGYYLLDIMIKLELNAKLIKFAKETLHAAAQDVHGERGFSTVRINVDVDPN